MTSEPLKKWALVTGASRGIGRGISERLGRDGFHVVVNFASQESKAREVVSVIQAAGGSAESIQFDVSQSAEVDHKIEELAKRLGPMSALVNNAGITVDGLLLRLKDEDLERTLSVDLKGAIYCTRAASRSMLKARDGSIIQISSVIGECGSAGQSAYAAAKAGLIGFSKSIAKELASRFIRVNIVAPGFIQTEMTDYLTEAQKEAILRSIPLGTLGTAEDVAHVVGFLASSDSRYITGQVIGVNGGMYM